MALVRCSECGKEFSDKASACPNCGCPIEEIISVKQTVASDKPGNLNSGVEGKREFLLREYLEKIRKLETDIYTIDSTIKLLFPKIKKQPIKIVIEKPTAPSKPEILSTDENPAKEGLKEYWSWIRYGDGVITRLWDGTTNGIKTAIAANKRNKNHAKWNVEAQEKYERDLRYYQEITIPEYTRRVEEENKRYEQALAQITLYNEGIQKNISLLEDEKSQTQEALKKLYDTEIIYPKYHGIVPVTMFCEYMDSGRRTVLEGIHGMYDLYEAELLGQKIVAELGKINSTLSFISYQIGGIAKQLTGIARNQIMLYEEVARGNDIANRISQDTSALLERSASMISTMDSVKNEVNSIKASAEMSALNTEIAAHRVDSLAKIEEYEFSLRHPYFPSV